LVIDYGQRHRREVDAAVRVCGERIPFRILACPQLRDVLGRGCLTTDAPVPLGHYQDTTMRETVVPNRNMIFLSIAVGHAIACGGTAVAYAAHAGDHAIYPDCTEPFVRTLNAAITAGNWPPTPQIRAPFLEWTKADIVRLGAELAVPFEETWTCYQGAEVHCGACGSCMERREAFAGAGVPDPTQYA
jgi:7-cyano-7-deazaguanine synthase